MTRSIILALFTSVVCLLVIGGPIANALFQSPLDAPVASAVMTDTPSTPPTLILPTFVSKLSWVVFGAATATGIILTVSRRSQPA